MPSWILIKRVSRAGFLNFWRNGFVTLASVLVMTVTLFTLGLVLFTGVILNTTLAELRDKADINVYFETTVPEENILEFKKTIEAQPEVALVEYVSREDELTAFRARHQNEPQVLQSLEELGDNPFGAVLNVRAKEITQYDAISTFLENQQSGGSISGIDKISYFDEEQKLAIESLSRVTDSAERIGAVIMAILVAMVIAIAFNTVRLAIYISRDEIAVMRLVGAGQSYIRAPFVVEGALYGLIAGLVALVVLYPMTYWLGASTAGYFGGINIFEYYLGHFAFFFLVVAGSGTLLGAVASFLAVRRYLKI